jgi:hypothetical protein
LTIDTPHVAFLAVGVHFAAVGAVLKFVAYRAAAGVAQAVALSAFVWGGPVRAQPEGDSSYIHFFRYWD